MGITPPNAWVDGVARGCAGRGASREEIRWGMPVPNLVGHADFNLAVEAPGPPRGADSGA